MEIFSFLWFCGYVALVLAVIYKYLTWHFDYFWKQGIHGPHPVPFFGNCWNIWRKNWPALEIQRYEKYETIYGTFEGRIPNLVVGDPKLIQKILIDNFDHFENRRKSRVNWELKNLLAAQHGQKWKAIRTSTKSMYTDSTVETMTNHIESSAQELISFLQDKLNAGSKKIDLRKIATTYAIDIVANTSFGTKLNAFTNPQSQFYQELMAILDQDNSDSPIFIIRQIYPALAKLMPRSDGFQFFTKFAINILKMRRQQSPNIPKRGDFVDILLELADANTELNDDVIVGQMLQFLIAGIEPVAITIACCVNSLAVNPDIQRKLRDEVQTEFKKGKSPISSTLKNMTFLDQCIDETLRLHTPAFRLERRCNRSIAYAGFKCSKGTLVSIPVYAIHHDPKVYPDPHLFNPNRFSVEEKLKRNPMTFLPFGDGNRSCIAPAFARQQIKVAIAYLINNFQFHRVFETSDPPNLAPGGFPPMLNPKPVIAGFEKC